MPLADHTTKWRRNRDTCVVGRASSGFSIKLMVAVCVVLGTACLETQANGDPDYYVGSSMNFVSYLEDRGITYKENGVATDPFASVAAHGGNIVRLEHAFGPYENQYTTGQPPVDWGEWGRVKADLANAASHGLHTYLTLNFRSLASQIEPGGFNTMPDVWDGLSDAQIQQNIYDFTYDALDELAQLNLLPKFVAIGGETQGAFVEPLNQPYVYKPQRITNMMNAGFDAIRDIEALHNVSIHATAHIASGPDFVDWWSDTANSTGLNDYDVIGMSYYEAWDTFNDFNSFAEMAQWVRGTLGKEVLIVETAQPWTTSIGDSRSNVYFHNPNPGQLLSPAVQRQYLADLAADAISGGALGVITWGTDWVASEGISAFADQFGNGSSWENNAYWDYNYNLHEGIQWMADIRAAFPPILDGDVDGDGFVGIADLNVILSNWNQAVPVGDRASGDLAGNGDGFIGVSDLNVVLSNWNQSLPPQDRSSGLVPEPAGIALVAFGFLALCQVRCTSGAVVRATGARHKIESDS